MGKASTSACSSYDPIALNGSDPKPTMNMPATLALNGATIASSARKSPRVSWSALFYYLDARLARVSEKDVPMPYKANLEQIALSSTAEMVEAAKAVSKT